MKAIIDSNIIFSSLLKKESKLKTFLLDPSNELYTYNFLFIELFKYKDRIEKLSQLEFDEILALMRILFSKIHFIREQLIPPEIAQEAYNLCSDIDEKDTPFIALSLLLEIPLLTRDKKLIKGLQAKGFEQIAPLDSVIQ